MNAITKLELAAVAPRAFPAVVSAHDLHRHEVLDIVMNRRFGAEYQPIVDTVSGETLGFEALARFFRPGGGTVAPDSVFELLHDDTLLLFHTELEMKTLQIVAAPPTELLFLNLDPDSFAAAETPDFNVFTELFRRHQRPGRDILIEVIENLHIQDVVLSRRMIEALTQANIRIAMDDLGVSNGLVSFDAFVDSSYVKFDR